MKKPIVYTVCFLIAASFSLQAQTNTDTLRFEEVVLLVEQNYPAIQKRQLDKELAIVNRALLQTAQYPSISLSASASYQSDVIEVPFSAPGTLPPTYSKDHYNLSLNINQSIYDGGRTQSLKEMESLKEQAARIGVDVELYQLQQQVEQLLFNILIVQQQILNTDWLLKDMQLQLQQVQSGIKNGVMLPANEWVIQAEKIRIEQLRRELRSSEQSAFDMLSVLTNSDLSSQSVLTLPKAMIPIEPVSGFDLRPEYQLLNTRQQLLSKQLDLVDVNKRPNISAFSTAAYGRPGLNAFDDDLQTYWIIGLKSSWSFRNWKNSDKVRQSLLLEVDKIETDKSSFNRQLETKIVQSESQIDLLKEQLLYDEEIIDLREKVANEKKQLLDQGSITSTEWLTELNAVYRAKLNREIRIIRLKQAEINYLTKLGVKWAQKP